ncbi:MAG TPA: hypothetical protein VNW46_13150 [Gemmatimonadaceae bacterium]|nr:hypothetical protein [Gemmatimonadaceae bacterium]
MPRLTLSAKLYALLGAALCAGIIVSAVLWVQLRYVAHAYKGVITTEVQARAEARKMEVAEKMQVQEWSNLLLRGADTADRAAYTRAFRERAAEVHKHLETVQTLVAQKVHDTVAANEAAQFGSAFDGMSVRYDAGLRAFEAAGGRNAVQVDRMVRDQDRRPTEVLGRLLARLDSLATARMGDVDRHATDAIAISAGECSGVGVGAAVGARVGTVGGADGPVDWHGGRHGGAGAGGDRCVAGGAGAHRW